MDFSSKQAGLTRQQSRTVKGAEVDQTKGAFEKLAEQDDLEVLDIESEEAKSLFESAKSFFTSEDEGDEDDG